MNWIFFKKRCFFLNGNFGKPLKTPLISEFLKQKSFGSIYIYIRLLCSYLLLTSTVSVIAFFIFWEFRRHISVRILRFLCSHSCSTCWHQFRLVGLIFTQIPWAHKYLETSSCQQKMLTLGIFNTKFNCPLIEKAQFDQFSVFFRKHFDYFPFSEVCLIHIYSIKTQVKRHLCKKCL